LEGKVGGGGRMEGGRKEKGVQRWGRRGEKERKVRDEKEGGKAR